MGRTLITCPEQINSYCSKSLNISIFAKVDRSSRHVAQAFSLRVGVKIWNDEMYNDRYFEISKLRILK